MERLFWSGALLCLFFMNPASQSSFCLAKTLGLKTCLGCGIGHSIHYALHLDFTNAWKEHFMGIPASFIILWHILKPLLINKTSIQHGSATANDVKGTSAG